MVVVDMDCWKRLYYNDGQIVPSETETTRHLGHCPLGIV